MNKNYLFGGLAVIVAVVGFLVGSNGNKSFGGFVEQRAVNFVNGFKVGLNETTIFDGSGNFTSTIGDSRIGTLVEAGGVVSVASGSTHYTAAQLCDNTLVRHNITGAIAASASNFIAPTAAALIADCITTAGDTKRFTVENTSNNSGEVLTFVANTGIDLGVASTSLTTLPLQKVKLNSGDRALVQFTNLNGSSVSFDVIKFVDGD